MTTFIGQVKATIEKYSMIKSGDSIVVGVSGGADSLCLLHVLHSLKAELGISIFAVHLNHQFRGLDAEADADFVEQICRAWGIPSTIEAFDVPAYSRQQGLSPEEAGREIRYKLFRQIKKDVNANKIAVAQNLNDNVETVLMRLLRGTGLEGLKGIDPVREDIIRPLLEMDRPSIEEYCMVHGLQPRIDKTNLQPIYLRNKIRLELIPYLRNSFNPSINETIMRMAQVTREENEYLEQQSEKLFCQIADTQKDKIKIDKKALSELPTAMKNRLVRKAVEHTAGSLNGYEYKHFQGISELLDKSTGAAIELPRNLKAYVSYENLIIAKRIENTNKKCYYKLKYNYDNIIAELNTTVSLKLIDRKDISSVLKSNSIVYLDASKINVELAIRTRLPGDIISPIGMKGSKKLKEYLIDKKIPRDERDELLLLTDGSEIVWILGSIISEKYKVTANTEKIIIVRCNNYEVLENNINIAREEEHAK